MWECGRGKYLSEETTASSAFAGVEVDVDIVVFAVNGFLDIWLSQQFPIDR
jgi:hypothetical protein